MAGPPPKPRPMKPPGLAASALRRGRNDAFMSSTLKAPEASPVVAYR